MTARRCAFSASFRAQAAWIFLLLFLSAAVPPCSCCSLPAECSCPCWCAARESPRLRRQSSRARSRQGPPALGHGDTHRLQGGFEVGLRYEQTSPGPYAPRRAKGPRPKQAPGLSPAAKMGEPADVLDEEQGRNHRCPYREEDFIRGEGLGDRSAGVSKLVHFSLHREKERAGVVFTDILRRP